MIPNANARLFRLKAAQRDLIAACGGIERAAQVCDYSKSQVGRWNSAEGGDLMPTDAWMALEEECGRHDKLEALCAARGRKLADADVDADANATIMARYADVFQKMGTLQQTMLLAMADNRITPSEAAENDRQLSVLIDSLNDLRKLNANIRGLGGLSVVGGAAA